MEMVVGIEHSQSRLLAVITQKTLGGEVNAAKKLLNAQKLY